MIYCRPEVDNDVISGMTVDNFGMDVPIKFGDSRSNSFRDIRGADFVSHERTIERTFPKPIPIERNAIAFSLKNGRKCSTDGFAAVYLTNRLR